MKKIAFCLITSLGALASLAEGEAGSGDGMSLASAESAVNSAKEAVTQFATSTLSPAVLAIAGGFLAVTFILVAFRWIRRAGK